MIHAVKRKLIVSSDSFCARAVSDDAGVAGSRISRNSRNSVGSKEEGFRLSNVHVADVEVDMDSDDSEAAFEKLKAKCACTIL